MPASAPAASAPPAAPAAPAAKIDALSISYWQPFHFPADHAHSIQVLFTCRALAAAGCRVELAVKRSAQIPVASLEEGLAWYGLTPHPNLQLRWLPTAHNGIQGLVARWQARRAGGPHHTHYARHLGLARTAASAGRTPVVVELHKVAAEALACARLAAGVVCITEPLRAAIARELPPGIPSVCIPDAVDLQRFVPPQARGPGRLVYVGQLHEWKGVDLLLRALVPLRETTALVIGGRNGSDPRRSALQQLAAELGVADRVTWTGFLPQAQVPAALRLGDIGVVPTRAANGQDLAASPLKLFEYMACGLPVIASDMPSLRDVIHDDENGLLFEEGSPEALAAQARRAFDAQISARLAVAGRAEAARHSWNARARAILDFLRKVRRAGHAFSDD